MKVTKFVIKLLMNNPTDKRLLTQFLLDIGYIVNDTLADEWSNSNMIITDEFYARQFGRNLLLVKAQPGKIFFPLVIMLPASSNASAWVNAGYDEVLRLPFAKGELIGKLKFLFQMQETTNANHQFILNNIQIGTYCLNAENRIMIVNPAFVNILECQSSEQILNQDFLKLGINFQENRKMLFKKINEKKMISGYESFWVLKNGKKRLIRESLTFVQEKNDGEFYYIGTIEDISNTKQLEKEKNG